MTAIPFEDRVEAGQRLARSLDHLRGRDLVVLGLPRGGVPVAREVAQALGAPLDVLIVRKLGVPYQTELAMGAVGEDGVRVLNDFVLHRSGVGADELAAVEQAEREELSRRAQRFRGGRPPIALTGRTAVVVDDGIATGSTARAACQIARARGAAEVVLAVPVAPTESVQAMRDVADEVVCVEQPRAFFAIGEYYHDFSQTRDDEVVSLLLDQPHSGAPSPRSGASPEGDDSTTGTPPVRSGPLEQDVQVQAGPGQLAGRLSVPIGAPGVVVFAHGSGSSRFSPRNRHVAAVLNDAGLGTLLFDLLDASEERDRVNVFDIRMLAGRLVQATGWLRGVPELAGMSLGYFGASTGAAAALWAAAEPDVDVAAVVSRGGRVDLAAPRLAAVQAPTLLVVGGNDPQVLDLNRHAQRMLHCPNRLTVVPAASHLFEEPGTLDAAAALACEWFDSHLDAARSEW